VTLLAGRRRPGLGARLDALDAVLELAPGRVEPALVAEAGRLAGKAGDRLRFGEAHTVVALAGTTGSGKSSLFNALTGEPLSQVGMRRPTTGSAHAAVWGPEPAGELLDWLEVPRRHALGDTAGGPGDTAGGPGNTASDTARDTAGGLDGLVLLDLPDVDSVAGEHRLTADRLVDLVDVVVWVLDPQKYADATIHHRYLAPLARHAGVMVVVLNQVDRLPPGGVDGCVADLERLLREDGLERVPLVPASAATGRGLADLRFEIAGRVAAKRAAVARLEADLTTFGASFDGLCGGSADSGGVGRAERTALVGALGDAAGIDVVTRAVAGNHRLRARRATGWPVTRWTSRLRLDPVRRLRLREKPSELVRTSLPGPSAVQRARVDEALRELAGRASAGLPEPWPTIVRGAATATRPELPDLLDRAVSGADLGLARRPRWWRVAGVLQLLLMLAAVAGLLWLTALFAVDWLRLPEPPVPDAGPLPVPTVLLAGGLLLGFLLALLSSRLAAVGARRAAARARRRLDERVAEVAQDAVVAPVERELAAHRDLCAAVAALAR
jgi:GTP-binding protein EngB required for normal cell division